jgi:hypothetical protein
MNDERTIWQPYQATTKGTTMTPEEKKQVDQDVKRAMQAIGSTEAGRTAISQMADKHSLLDSFQVDNGLSDDVIEAAIKEWSVEHGHMDFDLAEVQAICLRRKSQ